MNAENTARDQVRLEIQRLAADTAAKAGRTRGGWAEDFPSRSAAQGRERLAAHYDALSAEWTRILELADAANNGRTPSAALDPLTFVDADPIQGVFFCLFPRCSSASDPRTETEIATHLKVKHGLQLPVPVPEPVCGCGHTPLMHRGHIGCRLCQCELAEAEAKDPGYASPTWLQDDAYQVRSGLVCASTGCDNSVFTDADMTAHQKGRHGKDTYRVSAGVYADPPRSNTRIPNNTALREGSDPGGRS